MKREDAVKSLKSQCSFSPSLMAKKQSKQVVEIDRGVHMHD